jgi:hypothetical protein
MKSFFTPKSISAVVGSIVFLLILIGWYWSFEADVFDVNQRASQNAIDMNEQVVAGYTVTTALIEVGDTLLNTYEPPGCQ